MSKTMNALFYLPLEGRSASKASRVGVIPPASDPHPNCFRFASAFALRASADKSLRFSNSTSPQGGGGKRIIALTGGISQ